MTPPSSTTNNTPHEERQWNTRRLLTFPTQRPNEHVILLLRRHWTVILKEIAQLLFTLLLLPIFIGLILIYTDWTFTPGTLSYIFAVQGIALYMLVAFLVYFHDFVDYHLDVWIVTDQRIVSIEQKGLFQRVISEVSVERVQDVTSEVKGPLQTFLDFGQVHIQTAGEQQRFLFDQIAHPSEVAKVILQIHERAMRARNMEMIREEVAYEQQYYQQHGRNTVQQQQQQTPKETTETEISQSQQSPQQNPEPKFNDYSRRQYTHIHPTPPDVDESQGL